MIVHLNGQFLPDDLARIAPTDRGFLFADGIYEVIRFYKGKPFRQDRHLQRLSTSAQGLRFPQTVFPELPALIQTLLEKNDLSKADALIYIQITRGSAPRTHYFPPPDTPLTTYLAAKPFQDAPLYPDGLCAIIVPDDRWSRCHLKTTSLLANTLAYQQAKDAHAHEAIFSRAGQILEGSHTNLAMVHENTVLTPPLSNLILPGITREAMLELCRALHIPAKETPIPEPDLLAADELMLLSTTLEITPITTLNGHPIHTAQPGPITTRLRAAFHALART